MLPGLSWGNRYPRQGSVPIFNCIRGATLEEGLENMKSEMQMWCDTDECTHRQVGLPVIDMKCHIHRTTELGICGHIN